MKNFDFCYRVTVFCNGHYLTDAVAKNASVIDALRTAFADDSAITIEAEAVYTDAHVRKNAHGARSLVALVAGAELEEAE